MAKQSGKASALNSKSKAPAAAPKGRGRPAGVSGKKAASGPSKSQPERFNIYIFRILKSIHPNMSISKRTMSIMNSIAGDVFNRIAKTAAELTRHNKKRTLSSREVQAAVRLLLPGELAKHAITEGTKAVTKISS